jgi:hypothetical protein
VRPGAHIASASKEGISSQSRRVGPVSPDTVQIGTTLGLGPFASLAEVTNQQIRLPFHRVRIGLLVVLLCVVGTGIGLLFILAKSPVPKPSPRAEEQASAVPTATSSPVRQALSSESTTPGDAGTSASVESSAAAEAPAVPPMPTKSISKRSKPVAPSRTVSSKATTYDHLYKRD